MSEYSVKPSYESEEEDWNEWRDEELLRDDAENSKMHFQI